MPHPPNADEKWKPIQPSNCLACVHHEPGTWPRCELGHLDFPQSLHCLHYVREPGSDDA